VPRRETPTEHLRALARRISEVVVEEVAPRSVLLTGSTATGEADFYSDLDLIVYCDELPAEERIGAVIERVGGETVGTSIRAPRTSTARASSWAGSSASSRS
jgi:predicted nucleotidyltransferase